MPYLRPSGGARVRSRQVGGFVIAEARYRADVRSTWHSHALMGLAVVMDGGYVKRMHRSDHDCRPGTLTVEPPGVSHAESYGPMDVRALLIEVLPWRLEEIDEQVTGLSAPVCARKGIAGALGRRAWLELRMSDSASALALEGIALELIGVAGRAADGAAGRSAVAPPWLVQVTERLRDDFRSDIPLSDLAAAVAIHPAHLARAFRAQEGCSVGEFVRRLRIEWAAGQLATTAVSLAFLARAAGFYDQSHFTRVFTRQMGVAPSRYRALHR